MRVHHCPLSPTASTLPSPICPIYIKYIYYIIVFNQYSVHMTTNKYSNNSPSTLKWQWRSSSDPFRMALLGIPMPPEPLAARYRYHMAASVAARCLGGGHNGGGDGDGDNGGSSGCDARDCIGRQGDATTVCDVTRRRRPVGSIRRCVAPWWWWPQ